MDDRYDVVIIGSGLGGLLCGAILGKNGYRVAVLEKNAQIGGCLQSYTRDGGVFDTGVHYIGGLAEGQTLHKIFSYVGLMQHLKLKRLDRDGFDVIQIGDVRNEFPYAQSYELFVEMLARSFPHERAGIESYCEKIRSVCSRFPLYNLINGDFMDKVDMLDSNARETIDSCVSDPLLRDVLAGNNCLYAGVAGKTPFYIHALILNSYIESAWHCEGGGMQIATLLGEVIEAAGGTIFRRAEVSKIIVANGEASRVLTKDNREFAGKWFISDLHPVITIALAQTDVFRKAYIHRISGFENTCGAFIMNVVFHESAFPFRNHNIYYYSKPEHIWNGIDYEPDQWPNHYALFLTEGKDGFARSASIMCYMRYSECRPWAETFNTGSRPGARGDDYEAFKEEKASKLFDFLGQQYPGFRALVKAYHTLTPLTYRDHTGTPEGSLYGILRDYREPLRTFIPARTKIPNLFLTGQNLNLHGVLGVSVSAIVTCGELLGNDFLLDEIRNS
ncbi:MAG: NAD(P)-binding protein [Bacteroidetes bacterium]|nr:NAD(P)-binding protein [Bacteroidota bacterium]